MCSSLSQVGLAYGVSTLYICQAHKDNGRNGEVHVSIDPNQHTQWGNVGLSHIKNAGLDGLMSLVQLSDFVALPQLLKHGERFQFAFIDGLHVFDYGLLDAFYADLMLDVGGFLVFDDVNLKPIEKVVHFFKINRGYREVEIEDIGLESFELLRHSRMQVLRKTKNDDQPWDRDIDF